MKALADTNIFLAVALSEPEKERIIELTAGYEILSPEILPYEIGNALTAMVKRKRLSPEEAEETFQYTQQVPVRLVRPDIAESLKLANRFNIYAYDAYFLQCARKFGLPIITLDKTMRTVASEMSITALE